MSTIDWCPCPCSCMNCSGCLGYDGADPDEVYRERDRLVSALSKVYPSHLAWHEGDPGWSDDWRNIVCVHLPTGQATWHVHLGEVSSLFGHLAVGENHWDGHSTGEKYARLAAVECR